MFASREYVLYVFVDRSPKVDGSQLFMVLPILLISKNGSPLPKVLYSISISPTWT
jgi:hypothetical protein